MTEQRTAAAEKLRKSIAEQTLSREQLLITKFIDGLTFPKRFRGVDEAAVWQAMGRLAELYEDALTLERSRRELAQRQLEACRSRQEGAEDGQK
jgi:hypothetical protein